MNRDVPKPETQKQRERRLRERGYADGLAGKPPTMTDSIYRTSYRRGQERAAATEG